MQSPLFGPGVVQDDVDEVVPDERGVEVLEHVGVHGAEGAVRAVLHAVVEGCQNAPLEIRARMGGGDRGQSFGRQILAADAQHLNGQLVVRFRHDRAGIPSIALSTDTSILTAASNNYGYEHIFQRQVETLARKGDVVVAISTSGNSRNVNLALESARKLGAVTVAFTGQGGGKLAAWADFLFQIPSTDTARIQEAHIVAGHILCEIVESELMREPGLAQGWAAEQVKSPPQNHFRKI